MRIVKPTFLVEKHLTYLDELRESGEINMFGAAAYLQSDFDLNRTQAREILAYWMKTFSKRHARATA